MNSDYQEERDALMEAADAVADLPDDEDRPDYSDEPPLFDAAFADRAAADWWAWRTGR